MTSIEFNALVNELDSHAIQTMNKKGPEYTTGNEDVLNNFKSTAKKLGVENDYVRSIDKSQSDKSTGQPNVRYKIFQDILGDVKKLYRPVSGANEGFYKKPTVAQIEAFKKNI